MRHYGDWNTAMELLMIILIFINVFEFTISLNLFLYQLDGIKQIKVVF